MRSEMDTIPYPTILLVVLIVVVHNTISWNLMTKNLQLWTFLSQLSKFTTPTTPSPHDIDLVNNHPFRRSQISRLSCNTHHFPSFCCYGRRTQNELPRRHAHPFEAPKLISMFPPTTQMAAGAKKKHGRTIIVEKKPEQFFFVAQWMIVQQQQQQPSVAAAAEKSIQNDRHQTARSGWWWWWFRPFGTIPFRQLLYRDDKLAVPKV